MAKRFLLGLGVCLWILISANAWAATFGDYDYTESGGEITITGYNGYYGGDIVIPETIDGMPVTNIGSRAFYNDWDVTSITIPYTVTSIYDAYVFALDENLTSIIVDVNNPNYSSQDGVLYNKDKTTLIKYPEGKQGAFIIPDSVTTIGPWAFYHSNGLTSVDLGSSVTSIGVEAFQDCHELLNITIPDSVITIGDRAFDYCWSLTSVTIPDGVTTIGVQAFSHCTGLTSVTLPDSVTTIGTQAFFYCTGLTSINIPSSVTDIASGTFYCCFSLPAITIPTSITSIGYNAFAKCYALTSITIPSSVTSIYTNGFDDSENLTSILVDINNPSYSSQDGVLYNKDKTTLVRYPEGKSATEYSIPDSVTTIGGRAFRNCSSLTGITIPEGVIGIGDNAFTRCNGLSSVTIPKSVTSIGKSVFWGCENLTSLIVDPDNSDYSSYEGVLFNKGKTVLIGCPAGKSGEFAIPNSVITIDPWAFYTCNGLTSVTLGNNLNTIGSFAFLSCDSLTSVTIPESVTYMGEQAFSGCNNLSLATFLGNAPATGINVFWSTASDFNICYTAEATGFTTPMWGRYPAAPCACSSDTDCAAGETCADGDCEPDSDADGVADIDDNCPDIVNANQADQDNDTIGDVCDVEPYFLWPTQVNQGAGGDWIFVSGDLTVTNGASEAILWTTVDPDSPDYDLGWPSRRGVTHSYVSYREVGQPDWSAETETVWFSGLAGFASMWNWVYPASYIGVNGLYEIKVISEDAVGFRCEEVHAVEIVDP